jgi:acyl carrier protein
MRMSDMSAIYPGSIEVRVKKCIAARIPLQPADIIGPASLENDLGCDSLDLLELVMDIEDEFDIEIPDEDAEKIATVQQAIDYVSAKVRS